MLLKTFSLGVLKKIQRPGYHVTPGMYSHSGPELGSCPRNFESEFYFQREYRAAGVQLKAVSWLIYEGWLLAASPPAIIAMKVRRDILRQLLIV